jgi:F-type H+-transporting ATPase subunit b
MEKQLHEPAFWVAVAFVILVAVALKPLWKLATKALDARGDEIRRELEQARTLRAEAEQILASYQQKQKDVLQQAEQMLQQAKADAVSLGERAEAELKEALEKRRAMAMSRIAQAETKAVQLVQQHVVDIAVSASKIILSEKLAAGYGEELLSLAARDIEKKLH